MKFSKKRIVMLPAFAVLVALAGAQTGGITVIVDGQPVQFAGTGAEMVNGRVLVPLRGIFEKLGAHVHWNQAQQEVTATRGNDTIDLQIGNPNATVNGRAVTLDVPAQIVDGSTMVPIRFVSESVGAVVKWQEAEQTVVIDSDQARPPVDDTPPPPSAQADAGPVRMARISYIQGDVTWRPGDDVDWSSAANNLPLRQGAEMWLNAGARSEVQFDDGSMLRLGNGAMATIQTMYSDDKGEFTEIRLNTGTATLRLASNLSSYQVDTPLASVTASGPASFRVDATNGLRLSVRSGSAQVQGDSGQVSLGGGEFLRLADAASRYSVVAAPGEDAWDRFCDGRDGVFNHPSPYLPSNLALVAGDLNRYGSWVNDPQNGYCWRPNVTDPNWAPYHDGHWVWVSPFGWTWCANEPWGWAPYHYGTWFSTPGGWAWRPGPAQQYWSPAVVHFSTYNGQVAWCPLRPEEVHYPPAISIGFRSGNWALSFSIGSAAVYSPAGPTYCAPHPWSNTVVNRTTNVYNVTRITNIQNVYVSNNGFVPRNSRVAGGSTVTTTDRFAAGGGFARGGATGATIFSKGQSFAPPTRDGARFAGPTNVRPTAASFSPTHTFTSARPSAALLNRSVVRAPQSGRAASAAASRPMANSRVIPGAGASRPGGFRPGNPRGGTFGTNPRGTNLGGTNPRGTSPRGTNMGGNPRGSDVRGTNPRGTNLGGMNPRGTNPRGTNPRGVSPRGTQPTGNKSPFDRTGHSTPPNRTRNTPPPSKKRTDDPHKRKDSTDKDRKSGGG